MQKAILIFNFFLVTVTVFGQDTNHLSAFHFLEGIWKMGNGSKSIFEQWQRKGADELAGISYKMKGVDTTVFERVSISASGSEINYLATVKNQNQGKEVLFKLISDKGLTFVFENKEHDFPQRVIYQYISKDSLHAWIEGSRDGKAGREDYYYSRVK